MQNPCLSTFFSIDVTGTDLDWGHQSRTDRRTMFWVKNIAMQNHLGSLAIRVLCWNLAILSDTLSTIICPHRIPGQGSISVFEVNLSKQLTKLWIRLSCPPIKSTLHATSMYLDSMKYWHCIHCCIIPIRYCRQQRSIQICKTTRHKHRLAWHTGCESSMKDKVLSIHKLDLCNNQLASANVHIMHTRWR